MSRREWRQWCRLSKQKPNSNPTISPESNEYEETQSPKKFVGRAQPAKFLPIISGAIADNPWKYYFHFFLEQLSFGLFRLYTYMYRSTPNPSWGVIMPWLGGLTLGLLKAVHDRSMCLRVTGVAFPRFPILVLHLSPRSMDKNPSTGPLCWLWTAATQWNLPGTRPGMPLWMLGVGLLVCHEWPSWVHMEDTIRTSPSSWLRLQKEKAQYTAGTHAVWGTHGYLGGNAEYQ